MRMESGAEIWAAKAREGREGGGGRWRWSGKGRKVRGLGCLGGCGGENWLPCPSRPGEAGESGSSSVVTFWRPEQGRVDVLDGHAVEEVDVFLLAELGLKTVEAFEDV